MTKEELIAKAAEDARTTKEETTGKSTESI